MSNTQTTFLVTIFFTLSFAILIFPFTQSTNAECVNGRCDNGYGVFIYKDGRIYEGQWKDKSFNGMGALTFQNGAQYTGEFRKGLMHGYGRITLQDGKQLKCTFSNGFIENNDSLKRLWDTESNTSVEEHIFYFNLGNAYRKFEKYEKSIVYYDKSLKVKPDFNEAVKNRTLAKKQLAKQSTIPNAVNIENKPAARSENKPTKIILSGAPGIRPGTHSREWLEQEKRIAQIVSTKKEKYDKGQEEDKESIADKEQKSSSGTAFFINNNGQLVTNHHVISDCRKIQIYNDKIDSAANVIKFDESNDLAIIKSNKSYKYHAQLRGGKEARIGEDIITVGYPLGALLGDTIKVTKGSISSVTGIANDISSMQISAPIQPGSSGGPVLDMSGNVVGVVSSKLNELAVAKATGSLPQNINFAVKSFTLKKFLDANGIDYEVNNPISRLETADIAEKAGDYTVRVICYE